MNLRTPDGETGIWPFGQPYEETPVACADYIHANEIPIPWAKVELVLVDGFVRGAVLAVIRTKVTQGIAVFLHDYAGREWWYDWAVRLYTVVRPPSGRSDDRVVGGQTYDNTLLELEA